MSAVSFSGGGFSFQRQSVVLFFGVERSVQKEVAHERTADKVVLDGCDLERPQLLLCS